MQNEINQGGVIGADNQGFDNPDALNVRKADSEEVSQLIGGPVDDGDHHIPMGLHRQPGYRHQHNNQNFEFRNNAYNTEIIGEEDHHDMHFDQPDMNMNMGMNMGAGLPEQNELGLNPTEDELAKAIAASMEENHSQPVDEDDELAKILELSKNDK